jgi:hypothetical protein
MKNNQSVPVDLRTRLPPHDLGGLFMVFATIAAVAGA